MMSRPVYFSLLLIIITGIQPVFSQGLIDSLLTERQLKTDDYYKFRDEMTERTWLKLVRINDKAFDIIQIDNRLINNYLAREMKKRKELKDSIQKINLELALANKENEVQQVILNEKGFLNKTMLIVIGVLSLLFFVLLILYIDRQSRFRAARLELERIWTSHDDSEPRSLQKDEITALREQLFKVEDEKEKMRKDYQAVVEQKKQAESKLMKEITTRKDAEREIRDLIDQIRKS